MSTKLLIAALAVPLLFSLGCAGEYATGDSNELQWDDDDDGDDDASDDDFADDDAGDEACDISGTHPVDGDPMAYYRESLEVYFAQPVTAANIAANGPEGSIPGATVLSDDGLTATFDPYGDDEQHLVPVSDYEAIVVGPGCVADWTFTTSALGLDLTEDFRLQLESDGASYIVDLSDGTLLKPLGAESLFALLETTPFLMSLQLHNETALDMRLGGLDQEFLNQDPCIPTVELSDSGSAWLSGSHVNLSPITPTPVPIQIDGVLMLQDLSFEAELSPDGSVLTMGRFDGMVNGLDLDAALRLVTGDSDAYSPGTTCDQLEQLGSPCGSCPGAPEAQNCFGFTLTDLESNWLNASTLDIIGEAELANCTKREK